MIRKLSFTAVLFALIGFALNGCGSAAPQIEEPVTPVVAPVAEVYESPVTSGEIARVDLIPVLDAGLGRFLQGVGTEPDVVEGRFQGFKLTRLYPDDERFQRLDLQPGDTITRVNGQPIERPEQAIRVWEGLRVASELMVEYSRNGEPREIRFAIVD